MEVTYRPIGIIHSPFTDIGQMPIQPTGTHSAPGTAEVFTEFSGGLKDLDGFSHVILIYHLHQVRRVDLTVTPFLDNVVRGVFATRAPTRPNPIGLSVVRHVVQFHGPAGQVVQSVDSAVGAITDQQVTVPVLSVEFMQFGHDGRQSAQSLRVG